MRAFVLGLLFSVFAGHALAQAPKKPEARSQKVEGRPLMKQEDRQRMREDMREVNRGQRPEQQRQRTPQEREKLRQDIQDANQHLRR